MALIMRDLMVGNPRLAELGFGEEALGHNAIAAGFQGQRQWTDHFPNGDFLGGDPQHAPSTGTASVSRTSSPPKTTRSTAPACCFGHLLTNTAQIFADVRTYWSPTAVKRVTGHELTGHAAGGILHLINSGPATLDGTGQQDDRRQAGHEAVLGDHAKTRPRSAWRPRPGTRPSSNTSAAAAGPRNT